MRCPVCRAKLTRLRNNTDGQALLRCSRQACQANVMQDGPDLFIGHTEGYAGYNPPLRTILKGHPGKEASSD